MKNASKKNFTLPFLYKLRKPLMSTKKLFYKKALTLH